MAYVFRITLHIGYTVRHGRDIYQEEVIP